MSIAPEKVIKKSGNLTMKNWWTPCVYYWEKSRKVWENLGTSGKSKLTWEVGEKHLHIHASKNYHDEQKSVRDSAVCTRPK